MLIALAFGNNNANTSCNDNNGQVTTQLADPGGSTDPGTETGEDGGPVGGNTGQIPPPFTPPNP